MKILNVRVNKGWVAFILLLSLVTACGEPVAVAGLTQTSGPTGYLSAITYIPYNSSTTITWSSASKSECALTGDGTIGATGTKGTSGSFVTPRLLANSTYTLTCGDGSQNITIKVATAATASAITAFSDAGSGNVTVTSFNALTNGSQITISGTTHYNGTYIVANQTSTTFTIVSPFNGNDATGYWQIAGGMIFGCSTVATKGNLSAINLATYKASRYTGVAPLSVLFDASDTTTDGTITNLPFHEIEYQWDFGDIDPNTKAINLSPPAPFIGGTSTWNMGSKPGVNSRNTATGPVAAHVYETPGVYTVALTANDGTNKVSNSCAQIVVLDPNTVFSGTNTICIAQSTLPVAGSADGCPVGASVAVQPDFGIAVNTNIATHKRILFKRGDTFSVSSTATISVTGPGIVGAFGPGSTKPILRSSASSGNMISLGSPSVISMEDWRIMDLELDGQSHSNVTGLSAAGDADMMTLLRLNVHDAGSLVMFNIGVLNTNSTTMHVWTQNSLVDSVLERAKGGTGQYVAFIAGTKMAVMGNLANDSTSAEHVMRIMHSAKGIFSNNTFSNPAPTKQAFTLRGVSYTNYNCNQPSGTAQCIPNIFPYNTYTALTSQTVVSDNHFISGNTAAPVDVAPSDANYFDTRYKDIIFERNWYTVTPGSACCLPLLRIHAQDVTVRNEILDTTNGTYHRGIDVENAGSASPASNNVRLYNNTVFNNDNTSAIQAIAVSNGATNTTFINNLVYSPNVGGTVDTTNVTIASNNSTNTKTNPSFMAVPPTSPADFKISSGSYAIGKGIMVPVWSDYFLVPLTDARDMGAVMH